MSTRTLTIMVLLTALILTPMAIAGPEGGPGDGPRGRQGGMGRRGGFGGGMGGGMLTGRMAEQLGLSEEQKEKIDAINESSREQAQTDGKAVREAMQKLQEATEKGDEAAIKSAGPAIANAMVQQALHRAATNKKIEAVLTAEQKAKYEKLKAEMKERMEQMRQERQGQGRGQRGQRGQGQGQDRGPGGQF